MDDMSSMPLRPIDFLQGNLKYSIHSSNYSRDEEAYDPDLIQRIKWTAEYLTALRDTHKINYKQRRHRTSIPEIGEIVLIENELLPRGQWSIGKMIHIIIMIVEQIEFASVYKQFCVLLEDVRKCVNSPVHFPDNVEESRLYARELVSDYKKYRITMSSLEDVLEKKGNEYRRSVDNAIINNPQLQEKVQLYVEKTQTECPYPDKLSEAVHLDCALKLMLQAIDSMGFQVQPLSHRHETKHRHSSGENSPNVPHHNTDHNTTGNPFMTADEVREGTADKQWSMNELIKLMRYPEFGNKDNNLASVIQLIHSIAPEYFQDIKMNLRDFKNINNIHIVGDSKDEDLIKSIRSAKIKCDETCNPTYPSVVGLHSVGHFIYVLFLVCIVQQCTSETANLINCIKGGFHVHDIQGTAELCVQNQCETIKDITSNIRFLLPHYPNQRQIPIRLRKFAGNE
uniref:DUF5641 domain-containing protein n=1 Tax=Heterorhabditis bacteriophora TaxID=37862 RepID=A0A1I7WXN8_HETBA